MNILTEIEDVLTELLDLNDKEITPETYLILELGAESIDLLELAVAISSRFDINVKDDEIFMTKFRLYMTEAEQQGKDIVHYVAKRYPFLDEERVSEIISRIKEGPQLKIKDLIAYITYQFQES